MKENQIFHSGIVIPINIANIDTDIIIPKQFLQKIEKTGFGKNLFHDWRYLDLEGKKENPNFILNNPILKNASIILTNQNFGCGSSREHAVWALIDYGIKVIIAPSFSDIFYNNANNNNLLLITFSFKKIDYLFKIVFNNLGISLDVNLLNKFILINSKKYLFKIDQFVQYRILHNFDDISLTMQNIKEIEEWEKKNIIF